jgi:hypothetical protein
MTTVKVSDPDSMERKRVDSSGRIYVGKEAAGKEYEVVLKRVESEGTDE